MSDSTSPKRIGKLDSAREAKRWFDRGILPVPIHPGGKKPKGGKGWNTVRVESGTISHFFERGDNIGGLWGEPSGWIVDVDLDWSEAAAIAPHILPDTFIYGRGQRPRTHYLYRCEALAGTKFQLPIDKKNERHQSLWGKKSIVVEIRSTGSQSVLPPSRLDSSETGKKTGDRYVINNDVEFHSITVRHLQECCRQVAGGALLLKFYPETGARHDYIHALTGALLWGGWPEDKARKMVHAVLAAADDRETDSKQRARTIENTIEHFRKGNRISGWKTLSQWIPGDILMVLRTWMKLDEKVSEVPLSIGKRILAKPIPPELLQVPGLVGEIAAWSGRCAYLKQPVFDLATGLMSTALASMNKYVIDGWDTPIQPYMMLLAPTAGGKESALENIYHFSKRVGLQDYAFQGFLSYHAMLDKLAEPPGMAIWLWDEAARRMKSAQRAIGGQDFQIITHLIGMYGRANKSMPGMPGRANAIPPLENPFLTVTATAQPSEMMEAITGSDISTGLINRFVLFDVGEMVPEANIRRDRTFPAAIEDRIKRMKRIERPPGGGWLRVRLEDVKVYSLFQDFDHEARTKAFNGGGAEMWGRANQNALIMAGIVAIGVNAAAPLITPDIANWAIELIRWSTRRWELRIDESSSRSFIEKRSKQVERLIRDPLKQMIQTTGPANARLLQRGLMPRSIIARMCRNISPKELEETLTQLTVADIIGCGDEGGVEVFWTKL